MANLTGTMSSIMGVNLDTEAAAKYSEMTTAFGKEMPIQYGYMSEWDWYAEMVPCVIVAQSQTSQYENIKALATKADPTEDDRVALNNFMGNLGAGNFNMANHPEAARTWTAFNKYSLTWPSPFFKSSGLSYVYGWPNTLSNDPRRTGKVIVFKDASPYFEWLIQNSYKYGFVWYGPDNDSFIYVGQSAAFGDEFKAAAALGLCAALYNVYKIANNGKAPASKQEVVDWVRNLPDTGFQNGSASIPKKQLANTWIAWDVFMTKV
ncbi:hypothetical protein UFOVP450_147 [uncultured Caudovirales phage]|uniref:Uncharacterized protein n=1 Tax=uncultured Caudovirales phage TaxID=2100421 RepID=A0A6J5MB90_9CAUD|nr:hypothetical protein UFOVP450_147 [uncultured Caudovirales phage]